MSLASRQFGPNSKGTGSLLMYLKQKNEISHIIFENKLDRTKLKQGNNAAEQGEMQGT